MTRLAVLSDVHGNSVALEAVRRAIKAARPDAILVAGDHALNGPEPGAAIDALRELEADGALIVQGNTDIAVADFDYAAAFPQFTDGVPDTMKVDICAAVQRGRAVGVTVVTRPANGRVQSCVARAVRGLRFPSHPKLDVARTRFE